MVQANENKNSSNAEYMKVITCKKNVPLHITFHNPNSRELTIKYFTKIIGERLLEIILSGHINQVSATKEKELEETFSPSECTLERRQSDESGSLL